MEVLDPGHMYALKDNGKDTHSNKLIFFKDADIHEYGYDGTTIQEVLRACCDRVKFFDVHCDDGTMKKTEEILYHLRSAIAIFEKRHIDRCVQKGYPIEDIPTVDDHFIPNKSKWNI